MVKMNDDKYILLAVYDNTKSPMSVEQIEAKFNAKDHIFVNGHVPTKTEVFYAIEKRASRFGNWNATGDNVFD